MWMSFVILLLSWFCHAADVLFLSTLSRAELAIARGMGLTADVLTPNAWATKRTSEFKSYKAIIVGDPNGLDVSVLDTLVDSRQTWSPAIKGNIIILGSALKTSPLDVLELTSTLFVGTDPADPSHRPHSDQLMTNGIQFAVSGKGTGLYLSLSEYYEGKPPQDLPIMDQFGKFTVRGDFSGGCYDNAHIVATHVALATFTDDSLSNWGCSVHEAFVDYPEGSGPRDFKALAIALNVTGPGSRKFPDRSFGIPYILATNITAPTCQLCIPYPGQNLCHPTTACSFTPYGNMCLTRPGYKADGAADDDLSVHWRMEWPVPGHEHRVAVFPGRSADMLCDAKNAGPDICKEVSIADCAPPKVGGGRFESSYSQADQKIMHGE